MLHVISAGCVARDLHTIAPGPLVRVGDGSRRREEIVKKSRIAPFNAIIIIIIIIIIIVLLLLLFLLLLIVSHFPGTALRRGPLRAFT